MKGKNSLRFSIIWDLIIGILFATIIITTFISKDKFVEFEWFGVAIAVGCAYSCCKWTKNEIDYLKEEVKKLKENGNRKEIT